MEDRHRLGIVTSHTRIISATHRNRGGLAVFCWNCRSSRSWTSVLSVAATHPLTRVLVARSSDRAFSVLTPWKNTMNKSDSGCWLWFAVLLVGIVFFARGCLVGPSIDASKLP